MFNAPEPKTRCFHVSSMNGEVTHNALVDVQVVEKLELSAKVRKVGCLKAARFTLFPSAA